MNNSKEFLGNEPIGKLAGPSGKMEPVRRGGAGSF